MYLWLHTPDSIHFPWHINAFQSFQGRTQKSLSQLWIPPNQSLLSLPYALEAVLGKGFKLIERVACIWSEFPPYILFYNPELYVLPYYWSTESLPHRFLVTSELQNSVSPFSPHLTDLQYN